MPPTKLQRWLDVIAFLAARHFPVSVEQIMEGVPTYAEACAKGDKRAHERARRMFERDKVELREAGIPIETVRYNINYGSEPVEGYRLARHDFHLPYIRLLAADAAVSAAEAHPERRRSGVSEFAVTEEELSLTLEGLDHLCRIPASPLAAAASSAYRKLTFDLPTDFPTPSTALYLDPPGTPDPRGALKALSDALLRRKTVKFRYLGIRRGQATTRSVEPYGLMFRFSRWYLVGRDDSSGNVRVFRVSRMEGAVVNAERPRTPDYDVPSDFDLSAYAEREAWQLGRDGETPIRARVLFRFPQSLWAERNGHGTLVEERDDGAAVREFELAETAPFLRWLLPLGESVTVQLPAELRQELRTLAERVARVHERERP